MTDLEQRVIDELIAALAAEVPQQEQALRDKVAQFRQELEGEKPHLVMRHAAARVVISWLQTHVAELEAHRTRRDPRLALHYRREATKAQHKFMGAMKQLEALRRLGLTPKRKARAKRK